MIQCQRGILFDDMGSFLARCHGVTICSEFSRSFMSCIMLSSFSGYFDIPSL